MKEEIATADPDFRLEAPVASKERPPFQTPTHVSRKYLFV